MHAVAEDSISIPLSLLITTLRNSGVSDDPLLGHAFMAWTSVRISRLAKDDGLRGCHFLVARFMTGIRY